MDKPAIPQIPKGNGNEKFYKSIKECLETIMGRRSKPIKPLNSDASSDDVIAKINEILSIIQG